MGDGCLLVAQICEEGYVLNVNKDKCIPVPGKYAPFPLIFACIFLTILAYISRLKESSTLIVSTIVAFISLIETVGILTLIIHAY